MSERTTAEIVASLRSRWDRFAEFDFVESKVVPMRVHPLDIEAAERLEKLDAALAKLRDEPRKRPVIIVDSGPEITG